MKLYISAFIYLFFLFSSCKKFVDVKPPITSQTGASVYQEDGSAIAVLNGLYARLSTNLPFAGLAGLSVTTALSADELVLVSNFPDPSAHDIYKNSLTALNVPGYWSGLYGYILIANAAIEGLSQSTALTPGVKQQLLGEAKFIRALCYFYLVNLYGDVPLTVTKDYRVNAKIPRSPQADVYKLIISDLNDAENSLSENYLSADLANVTVDRVRPTKWVAAALLARVYLFMHDYPNAEAYSDIVIQHSSFFQLVNLSEVFLKNNTEAIWQLMPVDGSAFNTQDAPIFVLTSGPNTWANPVYLSTFYLNSMEPGDNRFLHWVGVDSSTGPKYYFPYKYKVFAAGQPISEYLMIFRLAEQYLIRSEARAQQDKLDEANDDLNVIRNRAGLANTTASDKQSFLDAILHERQVELFCEVGHRWLDLKRTSRIDDVMAPVSTLKGGTWEATDQLYPLPQQEIILNSNLVQNPGY